MPSSDSSRSNQPADDLQRLLHVVLRQGATQQTDTIILIELAQDFGPRVFETIRELARNARDFSRPPLIVLTGNADLNRVLDSKGMASVAQLTRLRFDFEAAPSRTVPARIDDAVADGSPVPVAQPSQASALVLAKDEEVIRRVVVDRDRMLIGRSEYSDICIASRYVSRQHALLLRNADGEWLIDLNSTNGTSVNSKVVRQQRLEHGDIINIGNYRLLYENPDRPYRDRPGRAEPRSIERNHRDAFFASLARNSRRARGAAGQRLNRRLTGRGAKPRVRPHRRGAGANPDV